MSRELYGDLFWSNYLPGNFRWHASGTVPAGSAGYSMRFGGETNHQYDVWGHLYQERTIGNGFATIAVRNQTLCFSSSYDSLGLFARAQALHEGEIAAGDKTFYVAGISGNYNTELSDPVLVRVYKIVSGTRTQMGSNQWCNIVDNGFIHFGLRLVNDGGNVLVQFSKQAAGGGILTPAGSPDWSSWSTIATDTSPGVLYNDGYWGFGAVQGGSCGGGGWDQYCYLNTFRLVEEG